MTATRHKYDNFFVPSYNSLKTWQTICEINHVKQKTGLVSRSRRYTRLEVLEGYLEGCKKRQNWGPIDSGAVFDALEREIKQEMKL